MLLYTHKPNEASSRHTPGVECRVHAPTFGPPTPGLSPPLVSHHARQAKEAVLQKLRASGGFRADFARVPGSGCVTQADLEHTFRWVGLGGWVGWGGGRGDGGGTWGVGWNWGNRPALHQLICCTRVNGLSCPALSNHQREIVCSFCRGQKRSFGRYRRIREFRVYASAPLRP